MMFRCMLMLLLLLLLLMMMMSLLSFNTVHSHLTCLPMLLLHIIMKPERSPRAAAWLSPPDTWLTPPP
jgi:hypothetical protein